MSIEIVEKKNPEFIEPEDIVIPLEHKTVQELITLAANGMNRLTEIAIAEKLVDILSDTEPNFKKLKNNLKALIADLEMGTVEYD